MSLSYCDCGCTPCWKQQGPHLSCSWGCIEVVPTQPDRTRVLGGMPGREIIAID